MTLSMHVSRPLLKDTQRGRKSAMRMVALVAGALTLAACQYAQPVVSPSDYDYRLRWKIAIEEGPRTLELFVGTARGGLNADQRADVLAFANTWRREATGGIVADLPVGTRNEFAAASALHEVQSILAAAGVPPTSVGVRPYRPADPAKLAPIKLNYPTLTAQAGPCGLWPDDLGPTIEREHNENIHYKNFGCASQRNLAAMVANKSDLIQPRGEVPPYTGRRTTALEKYRRGEPTQTQNPDKDQGKITDVGK